MVTPVSPMRSQPPLNYVKYSATSREPNRERQTDRQTDRDTHRQRQSYTDRHAARCTDMPNINRDTHI